MFRHKEKRLIKWEETRIVQGKLQKLKKTIDYICLRYKYKHVLENSHHTMEQPQQVIKNS